MVNSVKSSGSCGTVPSEIASSLIPNTGTDTPIPDERTAAADFLDSAAWSLALAAVSTQTRQRSPHPEATPALPVAERYRGMCDASAAIALDDFHFVAANDERNIVHIYRRGIEMPVDEIDLEAFLDTPLKSGEDAVSPDEKGRPVHKESDIEGAARIGDRIYWISSHGRTRKGKPSPERARFFATRIETDAGKTRLVPIGTPYRRLRDDLFEAANLAALALTEAYGPPDEKSKEHAPEADAGFNIEALAEGLNGELLIGFRNPRPGGKALIIPLLNPGELIEGIGPARFGEAILLDLAGRGLRSLEKIETSWLLAAGPHGDVQPGSPQPPFIVRRWDRASATLTDPAFDLPDTARVEAIFTWPDGAVTLLSDDGDASDGGTPCKERPNSADRSFAALTLIQHEINKGTGGQNG
jgi:Protein of unknown function (DUF3616)